MANEHSEGGRFQGCEDHYAHFAGRFYPANERQLTKVLEGLFLASKYHGIKDLRALIVPHAGYVFSGKVAAAAYAQIPEKHAFKRIFILASSHRLSFPGASIFSTGSFVTPLGKVAVDRELAHQLMAQHAVFDFNTDAHIQEHSLEVQLPFLQYRISSLPPIIPIMIGTREALVCKEIARALRPYFTPDHLFIISTDFSHYPSYADARQVDERTAKAIASNQASKLLACLKSNAALHIPDLATSLCGWTSVLTLLYLSQEACGLHFDLLKYMNSGDVPLGDKDGVVGYYAISLRGKEDGQGGCISMEGRRMLLALARQALVNFLSTERMPEGVHQGMGPELSQEAGAFVSLYHGKSLRGCVGRFSVEEPLYMVVQHMAIAAARDSRFKPLQLEELPEIDIEISVLTPLEAIRGPEEVEIGRHGIFLRQGAASGTLLPQVATQFAWSAEEFLGYCARDKAGLGWEGWKKAELFRFESFIFSEKERLPL